MANKISPFLFPGLVSQKDSLAIVHCKRDLQIPIILRNHDEDDEGYAEGKVVNTRFGTFPHSTLIGLPWGSQVRASKVDTGSRGRRGQGAGSKRKREDSGSGPGTTVESQRKKMTHEERQDTIEDGDASTPTRAKEEKEAVVASSGFIHLLPPTPENWTSSLPHRTQVVYTPDYSYVLHRLRVRPGSSLIEAGAGSGSFTHASARAVFSGYPDAENRKSENPARKSGKVWSYEFHQQRYEKLQKEICDHGLERFVHITHRDVCEDGFLVDEQIYHEKPQPTMLTSPLATAIFLDLPAPWLALPHLTRSRSTFSLRTANITETDTTSPNVSNQSASFISPLNPSVPVYICTFSPCIEQVQRTVSAMRHLGWVDIEMVELAQKRLDIRRERIGLFPDANTQRGVQLTPASVNEAVARLIEVEGSFKDFHENGLQPPKKPRENGNRREAILETLVEKKTYKEGKLVCRAESEVKTHTSYLVFAVLPMQWTEEDEQRANALWPIEIQEEEKGVHIERPISKKALKRAARLAQKDTEEATGVECASEGKVSKADGNIIRDKPMEIGLKSNLDKAERIG